METVILDNLEGATAVRAGIKELQKWEFTLGLGASRRSPYRGATRPGVSFRFLA